MRTCYERGDGGMHPSRGKLYPNSATQSRLERDEHFQAEPFPFATNEVRNTGLSDAKTLCRLSLREFVLLDVNAEITHEVGAHLQNGGLGWVKAKLEKNVTAGPRAFLFHS